MKIEKRGTNYRVQMQENGVRYSLTFPHKPTHKEIYEKMSTTTPSIEKGSFAKFTNRYIDMKSNILSPSTIRAYKSYLKNMPKYFVNTEIHKIDQPMVQKFINTYALNHAPKTVSNMFGLISIVLKTFRPEFVFRITLPKRVKKEPYIPTLQDIKIILSAAQGTNYLSAILLAMFGLRRSEIIALTYDDLYDNYIAVNKAIVIGDKNEKVLKPTKTYTDRIVYMPPKIINLIRQNGLYKYSPNKISEFLNKVQTKYNLKHFSIHKLRHFYASICHYFNMPDSYIQKQGGWSNSMVMKSIYTHTFEEERKYITENINNKIIENLFTSAPNFIESAPKLKKSAPKVHQNYSSNKKTLITQCFFEAGDGNRTHYFNKLYHYAKLNIGF